MAMPSDAGSAPSRHYDRAPIIEASIIIGIKAIVSSDDAVFAQIGKLLGDAYPNTQTLAEFVTSRRQAKPNAAGMVFSSKDGKQIVQARSDGLRFTRQAPYDRWETFLPEARKAWEHYRDAVEPIDIIRLTVKYVNVISIPLGISLPRLFNTYPTIPWPERLLNSLQMRYAVDVPEPTGQLSVLMVFLERGADHTGKMVLDNTFSFKVASEAEVWEMMPRVRRVKNETFESQITDELRKTFNERSNTE
jgi:uncharacterized protein (TIGR04255 family)